MNKITQFETKKKTHLQELRDTNAAVVDKFESKWTKWDIDQTAVWFKYCLGDNISNHVSREDQGYFSDDTETESDSEPDSDDDYQGMDIIKPTITRMQTTSLVDIQKSMHNRIFESRHYLPTLDKRGLKRLGFVEGKDYRFIYGSIKRLMGRYPVHKRKRRTGTRSNGKSTKSSTRSATKLFAPYR